MRWEHFARHTAVLYPFADRPPTILGQASAAQAISNEPRDQPHDHADDYDGECKLHPNRSTNASQDHL